jgi:hypothetical protein
MEKPIVLVWLTLRGVAEFSATEAQVAEWQARLPELEFLRVTTQEDFIRNLSRATYIMTYRFCEAWLALTYRAKWISTPAAGRELLGEKFPERLKVTFGTFHGAIMAESAVGMLLSVRRGLLPGIGLCTDEMPWPEHYVGRRIIAGSKAVILGYGNIGKAIDAKLSALGVSCIGVSRRNLAELKTYLKDADTLFLALPGTAETTNIIGAEELACLPAHAVIINVADILPGIQAPKLDTVVHTSQHDILLQTCMLAQCRRHQNSSLLVKLTGCSACREKSLKISALFIYSGKLSQFAPEIIPLLL